MPNINTLRKIVFPGAVAPFLPTDLPDLAVWLRADKGITTQGGAMDKWLFGNGTFRGVDRVSQGTGAQQPTHVISDAAYNNQSVISFDGGDWLDTIAFSSQISQPNTIFCVGNFNDAPAPNQMFDAVNLDASIDRNSFFIFGSTYRINAGVTLTGGAVDTSPHIFENIYNGASSEIIRDGVSDTIGDAGVEPMKDLRIGATFGAVNELNGKVAELIVYNRLLTDDESLQVRVYLQSRYQTPALP